MVPEGWKESVFGEAFNIKTGIGFKYAEYADEGIPLVKIDNVSHGYIKWENISYLPEDYLVQHADLILKEGDIVVALNRPITQGKLKIARIQAGDFPSILYQRVGKIYPITDKTNQDYFYYGLEPLIFKFVKRKSIGSDQPFISTTELKKIKLLIPPLPEQKKIAQILSTWDKAITTTEQLLANSQQQKKALMQQLLTGKKRLLDDSGVRFNEKWQRLKLKQLFDFKRGKGLSKAAIVKDGMYKTILYGELFTRYSEIIKDVVSKTNDRNSVLSVVGDILIPSSTTTTGIDLANATALLEADVLLGGDINILRPKKNLSSEFFAYLLTHIEKFQIASFAQGVTIIHLYGSDLRNIKVLVPQAIEEQQKIVAVLTAADDKITALQQKLELLKKEKKALMQQLLTGKRRVIINNKDLYK